MDDYILFSKNGEGSFEVKIPFSPDSLSQVSDLLTKEGLLVHKGEIDKLQAQLAELKALIEDMRKESEGFGRLVRDMLKGLKEGEPKVERPASVAVQLPTAGKEEPQLREDKISMLPSAKTKAYELISRLAKEHMDKQFTTTNLTLYEKRVFSLLVKRYDFVEKIRKDGRSIVYKFSEPALESICREVGGSTSISVTSRVRSRTLDEFLESMKQRYPYFAFIPTSTQSAYKQYKLLFCDRSVKKSVMDNISRMFGPSGVKFS